MPRVTKARRAVRLLGAAAVAGVLSAGLLAAPVTAGAVNGVKSSSSDTSRADVNGVAYRAESGTVNGVKKVNGVGARGVGPRSDLQLTTDVNGVKKVNGV